MTVGSTGTAPRRGGAGAGGAEGAKRELRAQLRALRDGMDPAARAAADAAIARRVCALRAFQEADTVFSYVSVGAEVDTRAIIRAAWDAGKLVAAPRVVPGTHLMTWYRIGGFDELERSRFGVPEPREDPARLVVPPARDGLAGSAAPPAPVCGGGAGDAAPGPSTPSAPGARMRAVALVPGFSFDARGFRLGYGGGFYDAFLAGFGGTAVGLCRAAQLASAPLPCEPHDRPVDLVVTG